MKRSLDGRPTQEMCAKRKAQIKVALEEHKKRRDRELVDKTVGFNERIQSIIRNEERLDALDRATELLLLFEPEAILKVDPEAISKVRLI